MKKQKLQALRQSMKQADLPLKEGTRHLVFGEGNSEASLMFIGEAPGRMEDEEGRPFVGSAGRELNSLLDEINLKREDVYITSILKYRPPKNRNPRKEEIRAHTPYLIKQIQIIEPNILITLGNFATHYILSSFGSMTRENTPKISECHGRVYRVIINSRQCKVIPIHHPAAILYNRKLVDVLKTDFKKIKRLLPRS